MSVICVHFHILIRGQNICVRFASTCAYGVFSHKALIRLESPNVIDTCFLALSDASFLSVNSYEISRKFVDFKRGKIIKG